jgi:hypothetical protein
MQGTSRGSPSPRLLETIFNRLAVQKASCNATSRVANHQKVEYIKSISTSMKKSNEYARLIRLATYENMPKTVLAAIAVAFAAQLEGGDLKKAEKKIMKEWDVLHANGIVPQKPLSV